MGGNGSYSTQAVVDTDQTLTVNIKKEVSFQIPAWQKQQFHLPVIREYGNKAMFRIWNNTDAQILYDLQLAAQNVVDDGKLDAVEKIGHMLETLVRSFVLMPQMV